MTVRSDHSCLALEQQLLRSGAREARSLAGRGFLEANTGLTSEQRLSNSADSGRIHLDWHQGRLGSF